MESNKTSYNGRTQWEEVSVQQPYDNSNLLNYRVIALCYFFLSVESCPEHNFKTNCWNLIKLQAMIQHIERKCGVQES